MKKRVLLLDDDVTVVRIVTKVLGQEFDVYSYLRGDKALEAIRQGLFDAVVSDFDMEAMTGADFYYEVVKIRPELADRFVFHTSSINSPVTGVPTVRKPSNATVLRDRVRTIVS